MLLAVAVLFWAGNWVFARALRFDVPPVALAFWRWLIALVILTPFAYAHVRRQWRTIAGAWRVLALLALLATVFQHIPVYIGLRETTATNGALLNSVTPVLILLLSRLLFGERLSLMQALGVSISLLGVAVILTAGDFSALAALELNRGDLWVLLATLAWAIYTVCLRWRPRELSSSAFTGSLIAVGVAVLLPVFAWDYEAGHRTQWGPVTWGAIAYFAIFPSVLAYYFWNTAVARVGGERASTFLHLMPLFGAVLSAVFLGESLLWYHYAGALLIFSGIFIASRARRPQT